MDLGAFTLKILLLALPGLLGSRLYRKLKGRRPREKWEDLVELLIFSLVSYLSLLAFWWLAWGVLAFFSIRQSMTGSLGPPSLSIFSSLLSAKDSDGIQINWWEIGLTAPLGLFWGVTAALIERKQYVYLAGKWLGVASGSGDSEEWLAFNNSTEMLGAWVYVIDHKAGVVYRTGIDAFSRWSNARGELELVLEKTTAYVERDGAPDSVIEVGNFEKVYLCRKAEDLTIRLPDKLHGRQQELFDPAADPADNTARGDADDLPTKDCVRRD